MAFRKILPALGVGLMLWASIAGVSAQQWPSRPVKVVVPYGVGGVTDTMARLTADRLSKSLGQPFVIENKVGAGGAIGVDTALNAPRDGSTILFVGSTLFTVLPLAQKVNYEPLKDLVPVSITGTNGMIMVVDKDAPYSTLREFIDYARANPGKITYASGGAATNNHLSTASLAGREKLDLVHVPFGGGGPAVAAVVAGHAPVGFNALTPVVPQVKEGKLRALAVTSKTRSQILPDVPTMTEAGYPDIEGDSWVGILVPAGTPKEIVGVLYREIAKIIALPEMKERLAALGFEPVVSVPDEFGRKIGAEIETWGRVIRAANIRTN
jgi:tripartite-type tricarboxylate transporter receptor subunit TctC